MQRSVVPQSRSLHHLLMILLLIPLLALQLPLLMLVSHLLISFQARNPILGVSSLFINEEVFKTHILDQGVALSGAKKNSKIVIEKMAYYELYKVSKMLDDIYNTKENAGVFLRIPKSPNRSQV